MEKQPRRQTHAPTASSSAEIGDIILAHIHDGVFATDLDNRVTFWGPSAERMFGHTADAAIGRPVGELLPYRMATPEDEEIFFATLRAGRTWRGSGSARLPDGTEMWLESTVQPIITDGRVIGSVSVSRDMTRSKRTETALARVLDIIDFLPDATLVVDADRQVIAWNRAVEEMTGIPREEMLGQGDFAYAVPWHGERVPTLVDLLWSGTDAPAGRFDSVLRQGRTLYAELFAPQLRGGQGAYIWVTASALLDSSGDRVGAIQSVRDITERKRVEETLTEAKNAAEAGNRAKSDFLATMSHEIRTPMNGIIGSTDLLLATDLTEDQQTLASALRDSSEALLAIINDVLDLSKIEANSLELEPIPFDLRAAIDGVTGVLGLAAAHKNLDLLVSVDPGIPRWLVGDPGRLRQVLINLAGNAVKFTDTGEVVVSVALLGTTDAGKARLGFEVRDSGIGISPEARSRLFKSFSQADSSMSRRFGGTGLGLAISWRLVDLMGGLLDVSSRVGEGSTFSFSIELPIDPEANLDIAQRQLADARILVVSDRPASSQSMLNQLADWGIHAADCLGVAGARTALGEAAAGKRFTGVIIDDPLAGQSAEDVVAELEAEGLLGHAFVIMASTRVTGGQVMVGDRRVTTLAKPFRSSDLLDKLVRLDSARRSGNSAAEPATIARANVAPGALLLLVEDNEINRQVVGAMLYCLGVEPGGMASDGFEAVVAADATPFDLILMDCQMPGMDGFEATREIRSKETGGRHVPIVALTANATSADRDRCLAAGMDDYVAKPVRLADLRKTLERWLATAPTGAAEFEGITELSRTCDVAASVAVEPDGPAVLDLGTLESLRALGQGDEDILGPLVDLFEGEAVSQLASLNEAVETGDVAVIVSVAHTMKGSSRSLGAVMVGDLAAELERRARAGSAAESVLVSELGAALATTRAAFREEQSRPRPASGGSPGGSRPTKDEAA